MNEVLLESDQGLSEQNLKTTPNSHNCLSILVRSKRVPLKRRTVSPPKSVYLLPTNTEGFSKEYKSYFKTRPLSLYKGVQKIKSITLKVTREWSSEVPLC